VRGPVLQVLRWQEGVVDQELDCGSSRQTCMPAVITAAVQDAQVQLVKDPWQTQCCGSCWALGL
jgi:hypothetical protein